MFIYLLYFVLDHRLCIHSWESKTFYLFHVLEQIVDIYHLLGHPVVFMNNFFSFLKKKSIWKAKAWSICIWWNNVRESLGVNSNTLIYSGLENLGNDLSSDQTGIDMKAYHGLVFVFQSLGANFCQPIGVFVAKGSVQGIIVVKLCRIMILITMYFMFYVHCVKYKSNNWYLY